MFRASAVDSGDNPGDSAQLRDRVKVKLFAKPGEGNKPRHPTRNYHLLSLIL